MPSSMGGQCTSSSPTGAYVGTPSDVRSGELDGSSAVRYVEYTWCTNSGTCVFADGYYGSNLKTLIQSYLDEIKGIKDQLAFIKKNHDTLQHGGALAVGLLVFLVALGATRNPAAAFAFGSGAVTVADPLAGIALEQYQNHLNDELPQLQAIVDKLQHAYDSGQSVWYVGSTLGSNVPGTSSGPGDFITQSGVIPGYDVRYNVGQVLMHLCQDAGGLDHAGKC